MTIKLSCAGTDYSIEADGLNFTLIRHGVNNAEGPNFGKETTVTVGYYSNVPSAIKKILKDMAGNSDDTVTLAEYVQRIEEAGNNLAEQLSSIDL